MGLDTVDRLILEVLQMDGRITNAELAGRVGLSPSACHRRVRQLEGEGVIDRYVALVDRDVAGRGVSVFVEVSLDSQREDDLDTFEAHVRSVPGLLSCHLMAGDADSLLHVTTSPFFPA